MNKNIAIVVAVIVVLGLVYWMFMGAGAAPAMPGTTQTPAGTPAPGTPAVTNSTYAPAAEPAAFAARAALASKLGLSAPSIAIVQVDEKVWENGCLGLAKSGEVCTEATVDGYQVTLQSQSKVYTYRTNKAGTVVRAEATN